MGEGCGGARWRKGRAECVTTTAPCDPKRARPYLLQTPTAPGVAPMNDGPRLGWSTDAVRGGTQRCVLILPCPVCPTLTLTRGPAAAVKPRRQGRRVQRV